MPLAADAWSGMIGAALKGDPMKLNGITVALVLGTLACTSCQKPTAENTESVPPSAPVAAAPPAYEPPVPGRYFLRRKASVETDSGIAGYVPGTMLQQTAPGRYRTADGRTLKLAATDVTNNIAEARVLAGKDAATQVALGRNQTDVSAAPAAALSQVPPSAVGRTATPAPAPLGSTSSLNRGSYGETKAFVDTDGDGRKFDTRQKSRLK